MAQPNSDSQAELLKKLHRQRGGIKKMITELMKKIKIIQENLTTSDVDELQVTLEIVTARYSLFGDIQDQLEELDEEKEAPEREPIETNYSTVVAQTRKIIRKLQGNMNNASDTNSESGSYRANNNFYPTNIPIPSIQIPKFDGTPEKWAAFFSVFKNTIDVNQSLPKALKLYHLTSVLTDKAWSLIGHLEINDANYDHALSILVDKYEHTRRLARRHCSILKDYPHLKKDTPAAIGELVDTFRQHLGALKNLKFMIHAWDLPLTDLILSKLNNNTICHWEMTIK
ncbi:uncharacterized protein LOC122856342 [Aphidius gifuensis]|uniref:uncharacterized protein LOC122856342 n=1 Tax=Aphidius gifuensis TaxID=684658 RepID=UPI001CDCEE2A|nr:uncharacterized protein LOC122856342 [Aphidius gifuensis]